MFLASGIYTWGVYFNNAGPVDPGGDNIATSFGLAAGNYTWSVCIDPKDGRYVVYSELDPDSPYRTAHLSGPAFYLPPQYYSPFSASSVLVLT